MKLKRALFVVGLLLLCGCDPYRKKKCEWYLTPYPEGNDAMQPGWVSLCVSNFELGRRRCYFTARPDFVERFNGIPFRYADMKYTDTFPKQLTELKACKP